MEFLIWKELKSKNEKSKKIRTLRHNTWKVHGKENKGKKNKNEEIRFPVSEDRTQRTND